jgi:hypothetical protein
MVKVAVLLILISVTSVNAQPAKILICTHNDFDLARSTRTILQKFDHDSIDISGTISDSINNYDAVFILLSPLSDDTITEDETVRLKLFLRQNKKLYVEYYPNSVGANIEHMDSNSFWHYVGIDQIGIDLVEVSIHYVQGVAGSFTEGMYVTNGNWDPVNFPFGTWDLKGKIKRVLSPLPDPSIDIADTYETDSFKVVLHLPTIPEYREELLGRVICNYFGFCTPLKVEQSGSDLSHSLSVFPNPASSTLHIASQLNNNTLNCGMLFNERGDLVSTFLFRSSSMLNDIDVGSLHLNNGPYLLKLTTDNESVVKPIYLYRQ